MTEPERARAVPPRIGRLRLAATITTLVLLTGLGAVALGWAWAGATADDEPVVETRTGLRQIGDRLAVVQVEATETEDPGATRAATVRAVLVALVALSVGAAAAAWWLSGRARRVDPQVLAAIAAADGEDPAAAAPPADVAAALAGLRARVTARDEEARQRLQEVAHELRTPLAVARTNLDLATGEGEGTERRTRLDAVSRALDRLGRTVETLSEHGRLAFAPGRAGLDLVAEATALVEDHLGVATARGLHLAVEAPEPVRAPVDRDAFRTATGNLLDNAVRLAPGGSTVTVTVGHDGRWAHCAVRDEGPGIPASEHALVFQRGWRGRYDAERDDGATPRGLGLAIARQVAESQGGRITLRSDEGIGSTFVVWLPLAGSDGASEPPGGAAAP